MLEGKRKSLPVVFSKTAKIYPTCGGSGQSINTTADTGVTLGGRFKGENGGFVGLS